ncbi:MAG: hypothetical protein FJX74_12120 [Armatimonadetes bacterium]|nr:hypothetical protein [Armatimonadota bacterium]
MKQQLSPAVMVIVIVLVLAIVAAIGYFTVLKPKANTGTEMPTDAKAKFEQMQTEGPKQGAQPSGSGDAPGG